MIDSIIFSPAWLLHECQQSPALQKISYMKESVCWQALLTKCTRRPQLPTEKTFPGKSVTGTVGHERRSDDWRGERISLGKRRWNFKWAAVSSDFGLPLYFAVSWVAVQPFSRFRWKIQTLILILMALRSCSGQDSSSQLDYTMP